MAKSNGGLSGSGWSLGGATALVTGGTRGIGYAVVEELAGLGATIHTCSRNESDLEKCLREWQAKGFAVTGSVCDASDRAQREQLMEKVSSIFNGKLNILINNIGTNIRKPTVDYTAEEYSTIMNTNLESAYHLCQLAHPLLKASGAGSIVFLSSVAGVMSVRTGSIYAATKAAMNQIAKNFACEWAQDNIRSNSVAPWYIKTSLVEHLLQKQDFLEQVISRTAKGGLVSGRIPLPSCGFLHHRAGYLCRWWNDREWFLSQLLKQEVYQLPRIINSFSKLLNPPG